MQSRDTPRIGEVQFGDFRRTSPLVPHFGLERGQPIDRYYIEHFLEEQSRFIRGRVLEIGDDAYTRRFGADRVTQSDILHISGANPATTIVADLSDAPQLPSNAFDCIICTQTLQLIYDLKGAVATLHRILRPQGIVLATFPGISQTDDPDWCDSWYWSLTRNAAQRLFADAFGSANVRAASHGNVLTAMCFLHGLASEELRSDELEFHDPAFPFLITVVATKS